MIRPFRWSDVPRIENILIQNQFHDAIAFENLDTRHSFCFVSDHKVVGSILVTKKQYINYLVVDRAFQKQGIGSELLKYACRLNTKLSLTCKPTLCRFYERFKFQYECLDEDGTRVHMILHYTKKDRSHVVQDSLTSRQRII